MIAVTFPAWWCHPVIRLIDLVMAGVVSVSTPSWRWDPVVRIVLLTEEVRVIVLLNGLKFDPFDIVLASSGYWSDY